MKHFLSPDGHRTRVKLELDGHILNAEMSQGPDIVDVQILPKQNNPVTEREFADKMIDRTSEQPRTINVAVWGGYRARAADVGYLKAAYLAAFAKFGYRWILASEMDAIRWQVRNPGELIIGNFRIGFGEEGDGVPDGLYTMRTPVTALLVRMRMYGVFLPLPGHSTAHQISDWIDSEKRKGPSARHTYELLSPLPKRLEFHLDQPQRA